MSTTAEDWLASVTGEIAQSPERIVRHFPAVGRKVGRDPLDPANDPQGLRGSTDDIARAGLVRTLVGAADPDIAGRLLLELYRHGDDAERRGVLRGLAAISALGEAGKDDSRPFETPAPRAPQGSEGNADSRPFETPAPRAPQGSVGTPFETPAMRAPQGSVGTTSPQGSVQGSDGTATQGSSLVATGIELVNDALRTNDPRLVAAAMGEFAGRHLPSTEWRGGVLKCLFMQIPLAAVAAVEDRRDAELKTQAENLADERRAAGRTLSPDLTALISDQPIPA